VTRTKFHDLLYIGSLLTIAFSLPLSMFAMTIGICVLLGNSILEWNWKEKWNRLKEHKLTFYLISFPLLFFIGFIQTDNFGLAWDSYLMKLPLLIIPLVITTTKPLERREINWVLLSFIASLIIATFYSFYYLNTHVINDIREISIFISHIRFSLNIVLGIVILAFLIWNKEWRPKRMVPIYGVLLFWLLLYLFISQTLTGIVILFILVFVLMIYILIKSKKRHEYRIIAILFLTFILGLMGYVSYITYGYFHNQDQNVPLAQLTKAGNPYLHGTESLVENGHVIGDNLCMPELQLEWPKRSKVPFAEVEPGLIRYLNSLGLKKDAEGVQALSHDDIKNIENGYANVDYTKGIGLKRSLYPTFFSLSLYKKYGKIHQSSLLERIELWKTTTVLIKQHWLFGVGVGDHKQELDQQLIKQKSEITKKEKGCHNQYLTIWLSGGIVLLLLFLTMLLAPLFFKTRYRLLYMMFFIIITVSMFTEDTINTHAGVTFFAFFNSLFLLGVGRLPAPSDSEQQNK